VCRQLIGLVIPGVEPKCTEWTSPKDAKFSASYDRLEKTHGDSPRFAQVGVSRDQPWRYSFLDADQLIKYALGLHSLYGTRQVELLYLYWEPRNAESWPQYAAHRAEANDLAKQVCGASVTLRPISYLELWAEWETQDVPAHLDYLRTRYDRIV